jgi:hypothetical protein
LASSRSTLFCLNEEVFTGSTVSLFLTSNNPPPFSSLCSNKAQTHFPRIKKITGIPYDKMLFFDDCNWGDHVGMVARGCKEGNGKGVVGHRTPYGLSVADWYKGLELYKKAKSS